MEVVADQFEMFPDMPTVALPKRAKNVWEQLKEMNEMIAKHGQLLPISMAAEMLDLSRQRVYQLIEDGVLRPVEWRGQRWLTENDIRSFVEVERVAGRPWKEPSAKELWARARGYVKKHRRK
jgi:hypothetical protein